MPELQHKELDTLVARIGDLPAMPTIAVRIMEMISDPSTSANRLQAMISRDQALTAKVLKIANSAMFGVSRDISTLSHAVVILGFSTIRSIVLAASTKSIYHGGRQVAGFSTKLLWQHALASASIARMIAVVKKGLDVEEAFIAGLLHDIGKSVLNNNFHEKYSQVVQTAYNTGGEFQEVEKQIIGFDHTQVGALVARKWNLSMSFEDAILFHHSPENADAFPLLTACTALANEITIKLGIGPTKQPDRDIGASQAASILNYGPDDLDKLVENIKAAMQKDKDILSM
jgi:putative nucleotidyltransferase with HDIG domain